MIAVFLYVDKPVSTLQFDLDTPESSTITLSGVTDKQIMTNRVGGKLRVVIFGLNQSTFQGRFATVGNGKITGISGVVGSKPDATNAGANILILHQPEGLNVTIKGNN
jgi:hypothetical protein